MLVQTVAGALQQPLFKYLKLPFTAWRFVQHAQQSLSVPFSPEIIDGETSILQIVNRKFEEGKSAAKPEMDTYQFVTGGGVNNNGAGARPEHSRIARSRTIKPDN